MSTAVFAHVAAASVESDLPCIGCDYNLRTRPRDGVCPECGLPVRETLALAGVAGHAAPWAVDLARAIGLLLAAALIGIVAAAISGPFALRVGLVVVAWTLALGAAWVVSRRPSRPAGRAATARAWGLRLCAAAPLVATVLPHFAYSWSFDALIWHAYIRHSPRFVAPVALCLLGMPATFLFYDHLRRLAPLLHSTLLTRQAAILRWVLPLTLFTSYYHLVIAWRTPDQLDGILLQLPVVGLGGFGDLFQFLGLAARRSDLRLELPKILMPQALAMMWALALLAQYWLTLSELRRRRRAALSAEA